MNTSHKTFMAACLFMLLSSTAFSQSSGIAWKNGNVLTANQMQQLDNAKMNVDSLGKPGFAPKLNAAGKITDPVVGDVSGATATSDEKTVSQISQMAVGSVQKTDANQPNGYAKLDGSGSVTVPVTGNVAAATADAWGDTVSTIADMAKSAVPKANIGQPNGIAPLDKNGNIYSPSLYQTLTAPTINGGQETTFPTDKPGATGKAIPNTLWVDQYYQPRNTFINVNTTWTVCASGCQYSDVVAAFHDAMQANYLGNAILTISIADGTYTMSDQLLTRNPNGVHVHIIGDVADNSKVVLNFNNKANGIGGFTALDGGVIGYVDGITINGVGGIQSETDTVTTWVENSWGPGFYAARGGIIEAGPHVTVNHFYYSVLADEGGYFCGDGMTGTDAGDVGFIARHNGVLRCIGCTAIRAADNAGHVGAEDGDPVDLGCNYTAENGGTLIITQAKGSQSHIAAVCALTNGHVWADMFVGTGGLGGAIGEGLWAISGGAIQANHASLSGYLNGAYAGSQGVIQSSNATYSNNADDGVDADAGTFIGTSDTIQNNAVHGASAFHQGMMQLYNTFATMTGNGAVGYVEPAGTSNGMPYAASSLYLQ